MQFSAGNDYASCVASNGPLVFGVACQPIEHESWRGKNDSPNEPRSEGQLVDGGMWTIARVAATAETASIRRILRREKFVVDFCVAVFLQWHARKQLGDSACCKTDTVFSECGCCGWCAEWLFRPFMLGDLHGARSALAQHGILYNASLTQFYQGVAVGGAEQHFEYGGKLDQFVIAQGQPYGLGVLLAVMHVETRYGEDVITSAGAASPANVSLLYPKLASDETAITGDSNQPVMELQNTLQRNGRILNEADEDVRRTVLLAFLWHGIRRLSSVRQGLVPARSSRRAFPPLIPPQMRENVLWATSGRIRHLHPLWSGP